MTSLLQNAPPVDGKRYARLLAKAQPAVIESEEQNERTLAQIEFLMDKGPRRNADEDRLLALLARLVEDYETSTYGVPDSKPNEIAVYLMEKRGLGPVDAAALLGCTSEVLAELLAGRREISLAQARALAEFFGVSVALFL